MSFCNSSPPANNCERGWFFSADTSAEGNYKHGRNTYIPFNKDIVTKRHKTIKKKLLQSYTAQNNNSAWSVNKTVGLELHTIV